MKKPIVSAPVYSAMNQSIAPSLYVLLVLSTAEALTHLTKLISGFQY